MVDMDIEDCDVDEPSFDSKFFIENGDEDEEANDVVSISENRLESVEQTRNTLPEVSRERYQNSYDNFMRWQQTNKITSFSEDTFLTYFTELSTSLKPTSLWSQYSMIKSTIKLYNNVDIGEYRKVVSFLKAKNEGYVSERAKMFTAEEIRRFLTEAPDIQYLSHKASNLRAIRVSDVLIFNLSFPLITGYHDFRSIGRLLRA